MATIEYGDRRHSKGDGDIMFLTVGNIGECRQISVMIQQEMNFHGTFGPTELSPWE
jgi:hypothetical protein